MRRKQRVRRQATVPTVPAAAAWWWAAAFIPVAWVAYAPALRGAFVFDDRYLPFLLPQYENAPLTDWIRGNRPLLMFSFWWNYQSGGHAPAGYHAFNLVCHVLVSALITLILARLLDWAGVSGTRRVVLSLFGGGLCLLHPLQTESVSYVASRSETLSTLLYFAAYTVFLFRPPGPLSWRRATFIALVAGAALTTKEHTLTLPALLLLTDFFWNKKGVLENARLYVLMTILGMAGVWYVWTVVGAAGSVGSTSTGISSAEYFLTQCRVIWTYIRLFFFPLGQNLDHDVAISRSLLDPVALVGLMALIALVVSAWFARNRWPLASFGVFVFLLLIAPTSSVVPIADVMAEHRLYLPFFGLALVCLEFLRRAIVSHAVVTAVVVLGLCAVLTFERNQVWASPLSLWRDAVEKSPNKVRPRFQLAFAYYDLGRCAEAAEQYEKASLLGPPDHRLLVDWALALDCMGRVGDALTRLGQAAAIERTAHVYSLIGMIHGKQGHVQLALGALAEAERMDPRYEMTYVYRGNVFEAGGDLAAAAREYEHAVGLNSSNVIARQALLRVSQ